MKEIFKDIPGYEGLYQVSNKGRVKSLKKKSPILLKISYSSGYGILRLWKYNKGKLFKVHRLVAYTFLGLDINNTKMCVCHKDDNPNNNSIDNLFLGTHRDNMEDMKIKGRCGLSGKYGSQSYLSKKVKQYTLQGELIHIWDSIIEASVKLGVNQSKISAVCKGKRATNGGFIWKYK